MNFNKVILAVLVFIGVGYLSLKLFWESDFKKIDKNTIDLPKWSNDNSDTDEMYDALSVSKIPITEIYSSLSGRFIFYSFTKDYWIVGTSYNTLDDGIWFFATPTYTRVLIIDRNTEEVIESKLFFKNLTNAKLIGNELYFRYDGPILWELATNFYRLDELDSEINKLGKTSLNLN